MLDAGVVRHVWNLGRAHHPRVAVAEDDFARYLSDRPDAWDRLDARASDLYLACACVLDAPHAAEAFERDCLGRIDLFLGPLGRDPDFVAEVRQRLRIRFLVADGEQPPRIAGYRGGGPLEGLVRVAASRVAVDLVRAGKREEVAADMADEVLTRDGELAYLKQRYREPFGAALAAALARLAREHRMLLRLHYVEELTTQELASFYRVGRATVVRRLRDARHALLDGVAAELRAHIALAGDELDSLLVLVRSQLDVSVARLLAESQVR